MVGGEAADLDRARPILDRLARRVFHLGPLGTGAAMKLAVNTLIYGLNGAVAEGLVLAERNGIDRALAYDVLAASAAGAPYVGYKRATRSCRPRRRPSPSRWALADKDLRLIGELAEASGTAMPQAAVNLEVDPRGGGVDGRGRRLLDRSPVTCVRRAGDDRSAMRRRPTATIVPTTS